MTNEIPSVVQPGGVFWTLHLDYWVAQLIAVAGLVFSILAFIEAGNAKKAATAAGKTVKIQTITIELTEILQKLDRLQPKIEFSEARDLLTEISRRLRRLASPFQKDSELSETIVTLKDALSAASKSLNSVRPTDPTQQAEAPLAVYNAIQGDYAIISNTVADLLGLFEKKTIDFGDEDADS